MSPSPSPGHDPDQASAQKRVLIVEGDPDAQLVLKRIVTQVGAELNLVADIAAVQNCSERVADLAIVGSWRRGLEQLTVCRLVKATRAAKVIALVAFDNGTEREKAYAAGADAVITVPFSPSLLLDTIAYYL